VVERAPDNCVVMLGL